jgi:hypothetical protein
VRIVEIFFEAEFFVANNGLDRHDFRFFVVKPGGSYDNLFVSLPVHTVSQLNGVFSLEGGDCQRCPGYVPGFTVDVQPAPLDGQHFVSDSRQVLVVSPAVQSDNDFVVRDGLGLSAYDKAAISDHYVVCVEGQIHFLEL